MLPCPEALTTEHIKSHLQKYRLHYERSKEEFLGHYRKYLRVSSPDDELERSALGTTFSGPFEAPSALRRRGSESRVGLSPLDARRSAGRTASPAASQRPTRPPFSTTRLSRGRRRSRARRCLAWKSSPNSRGRKTSRRYSYSTSSNCTTLYRSRCTSSCRSKPSSRS